MNSKVMTQSKNIAKERKGRGFSLGELREAKIPVNRANSLGIILDFRRGTVRESNVALLKELLTKNIEAKHQRKLNVQKQTEEVKQKVKTKKTEEESSTKKVTSKKDEIKTKVKSVEEKKTTTKKVTPKKEKVKEDVKSEVKPVKEKKATTKKAAPKKKTVEE